jgi:hypothetical protein
VSSRSDDKTANARATPTKMSEALLRRGCVNAELLLCIIVIA